MRAIAYHPGRIDWSTDRWILGIGAAATGLAALFGAGTQAFTHIAPHALWGGAAARVFDWFQRALQTALAIEQTQRFVWEQTRWTPEPEPPTPAIDPAVLAAFELLGLDPSTATADEVEGHFRQLLQQHHPDRHQGAGQDAVQRATAMTTALIDARATLRDHFEQRGR